MSRKIDTLLEEYGVSHKNETNKAIHWICVPLIFWSIVALLYSIPNTQLQSILGANFFSNWASIALLLVSIYYMSLSRSLAIGMFAFSIICVHLCEFLETYMQVPLWQTSLVVFVLAWIGQFYGHKVEGKKPSFLKDLQFLLIGPGWLLHFIYKRLEIKY
ncbi:Mpo1-like protein [Flavicella sp.]|uniref:Mpo1 family 2-hydroxy fatty acid dioxygenase n=1 Tax=Flavicella sp. TaxID=2957742 RepID=UPI002628C36D|nr:Mpo1-like protein [Flavicella sp.]MDG1805279.1 DUF962 domain-containing protein [Flavicella sp.]